MTSVRPKTIASGGISPRGWTNVLTLLVVMAGFSGGSPLTCTRRAKAGQVQAVWINLAYLIDEYQLTEELDNGTPVTLG